MKTQFPPVSTEERSLRTLSGITRQGPGFIFTERPQNMKLPKETFEVVVRVENNVSGESTDNQREDHQQHSRKPRSFCLLSASRAVHGIRFGKHSGSLFLLTQELIHNSSSQITSGNACGNYGEDSAPLVATFYDFSDNFTTTTRTIKHTADRSQATLAAGRLRFCTGAPPSSRFCRLWRSPRRAARG